MASRTKTIVRNSNGRLIAPHFAVLSYLEKRQPAKNVARFYRMAVMPNLFGEWTLVREWGRIGHGGQVHMEWFSDQDQAIAALITLEAAKRRRGYWVEPQQMDMFWRALPEVENT